MDGSDENMDSIHIEPITSKADVPACAQICCDALSGDAFSEFLGRYSQVSFYDETVTRLCDAIDPANNTDFAFKAVLHVPDERGGTREQIVGVSHWYYGYLVVPKVDPFAKKATEEQNEISPEEVAIGDTETPPDVGQGGRIFSKNAGTAMAELQRQHGNVYVGTIRGKKHIYLRRMMVDPKHQKKGIGRKLLQWGLDVADRERIVSFLFARPVAMKMYLDARFEVLAYLDIPIPKGDEGLHVPPGATMLRQPQPRANAAP